MPNVQVVEHSQSACSQNLEQSHFTFVWQACGIRCYTNRLLYEYGEILTRVSIAVTRACECHANAHECQYYSIFVQ